MHEVSRPDYLVFKQQSSSGPKSAATSSNHTKHGAKSKQPKPKKHDSSSSASSTHRNKNHHQNHKLGDDDTRRGDGDKEDLGDRLEDVPGYTELKKKLEEFVRDDDSAAGRTKLEMPASLTARERYVVHEVCWKSAKVFNFSGIKYLIQYIRGSSIGPRRPKRTISNWFSKCS